MENEHNVILCEILPVPRTLPGTTMILLSLDKSLIFFILTIFFNDTGFEIDFAILDQIGALFFLDARFNSETVCCSNFSINQFTF